jgi:hypothetical protein
MSSVGLDDVLLAVERAAHNVRLHHNGVGSFGVDITRCWGAC